MYPETMDDHPAKMALESEIRKRVGAQGQPAFHRLESSRDNLAQSIKRLAIILGRPVPEDVRGEPLVKMTAITADMVSELEQRLEAL